MNLREVKVNISSLPSGLCDNKNRYDLSKLPIFFLLLLRRCVVLWLLQVF